MGSYFSKGQTTDQIAEMSTEDLVKILRERVAKMKSEQQPLQEAIDQLNKKKFELFDNYHSLQGYHGSLAFAINQAKTKGIELPPFPQFTKFEFENMKESQPVESPEYLSPAGLTQTDMKGLLKHNISGKELSKFFFQPPLFVCFKIRNPAPGDLILVTLFQQKYRMT